ncbi:uncharacterized protein LOC141729902 isoform X1 [Zonotrichia albicollis]|uniref:uncharacterized protein LOC141729902 isoform X1 n=1 Tax=Zonotrichia albicollis TaxID=44394 RepID=UPI003D81052B
MFQALSPELALMVTTWGHRDTVAAGVGGALLFLLLLVGVIVAWHWWHRVAARKQQERAPPDPTPPPRGGEGSIHPRCEQRTGTVALQCHCPPGSPGDLRGAVGIPRATMGTQ